MRVAVLGIKSVPATMGADRVVEMLIRRTPRQHRYVVYVMRGETEPPPRFL